MQTPNATNITSSSDEDSIAQAQLAAIVESSDDAIISKDFNGVIVSWNAAATRIFGFLPEEAIGQHISLIIPNDKLDEEAEIIRNIRAGRRLEHYETIRQTKDGRLIPISLTVSPVRDKNGRIIGASKVARDVSERYHTEALLKEERETLEILNRLAPALASTLNLEKLVQHTTDEATKITGAAYGAFFYNVMGTDGNAYLLYALSGADKDKFAPLGMPRPTKLLGPTFNGSPVLSKDIHKDPRYGHNTSHHGLPKGHLPLTSYLAAPVISRTGKVIGALFFGHPEPGVFTERDLRVVEGIAALAAVGIDNARLYEEVRQGQKKAEAANRAKSDFLATMSHEIRTPMNAIVGLASILSLSHPLSPKQKEYISILQSSADSLLLLINDLLDISKIEAHTIELETVPFSLADLIDEIASMMALKAEEKGLTFVVDSQNIKNLIFLGDPTRLRQIIMNLCSNAIKFTENGLVAIKVLNSNEIYKPDIAQISIVVKDTGIGISPEKQETIFEKFVQADNSISRKYGGTGLGLSITKSLVDLMEGTIAIESEIDKGSTFTVTVPLRIATRAEQLHSLPEKAENNSLKKHSKKVLIVEDHEPNILVAGAFLESMGYSYEAIRNGADAIAKINNEYFDIVLMDVQMPEMNGYEATQLIRAFEKDKGRKRLPIIGVTAHALSGDREHCFEAGMDDYLSKPFDMAELREKLEKFIK